MDQEGSSDVVICNLPEAGAEENGINAETRPGIDAGWATCDDAPAERIVPVVAAIMDETSCQEIRNQSEPIRH